MDKEIETLRKQSSCVWDFIDWKEHRKESRWIETENRNADRETDFYSLYYFAFFCAETSLDWDWSLASELDLAVWSKDRFGCQLKPFSVLFFFLGSQETGKEKMML